MAIPFNRYIRITSGVIGAGGTPTREFMGRIFTISPLVPTNTVIEFGSVDDVINFFGAGTEEARRAAFYFGYVSPSISAPRNISFARWANTDVGAQIYGTRLTATLADLQAVNAGGFTVTLAGTDGVVTGLDLSGAADFAGVATALQAAIRAVGGTFAQAEVTYNATRTRFEFDSGNTGDETIAVTDGAQTPLQLLGWLGSALLSDGVDAQDVSAVLATTTERTNNFGSFLFQPMLTQEQYVEAANWNDAQNVMFMFMVPVTRTTASALSAALIGIGGTGMTLINENAANTEFPEMMPMTILAATDYTQRSGVQNYMFREHGSLTPTVTTGADASLYDGLRVNYYGETQTAGQLIRFYQRGFLGGTSTDPVNMNTYANEIWLKDKAGADIMTLLRSVSRVSANAEGRAAILSVIAGDGGAVQEGLNNGTISVGRELTQTQRLAVQQLTGDPLAYVQVQNLGYWLDATLETFVEDGIQQVRVNYTLIYAKDDVIREVNGRHALV